MKRVLVVALSIAGFSMVGACGSDSMGDEVISTINPNPDVTVSIPSEEEIQAQLEKTEEFASTLIGLGEQEAITAIEGEGLIARVVARDGEYFAVTADYSISRINLVVDGGLVVETTVG